MKKYIDGSLLENSKIGLLDDLITTAKSKLESKELIMLEKERLGLGDVKVTDAYVLIDREQGGDEILKKHGIMLHSIYSIKDIFEYLSHLGVIEDKKYRSILEYFTREMVS